MPEQWELFSGLVRQWLCVWGRRFLQIWRIPWQKSLWMPFSAQRQWYCTAMRNKWPVSDLMAFLELCSLDLVVVHLGMAKHRTSRIKLISPALIEMVGLQQHLFVDSASIFWITQPICFLSWGSHNQAGWSTSWPQHGRDSAHEVPFPIGWNGFVTHDAFRERHVLYLLVCVYTNIHVYIYIHTHLYPYSYICNHLHMQEVTILSVVLLPDVYNTDWRPESLVPALSAGWYSYILLGGICVDCRLWQTCNSRNKLVTDTRLIKGLVMDHGARHPDGVSDHLADGTQIKHFLREV